VQTKYQEFCEKMKESNQGYPAKIKPLFYSENLELMERYDKASRDLKN